MKKENRILIGFGLALFLLNGSGQGAGGGRLAPPKGDGIQQAVRLEKPGLDNFYKISDILFRGAQPTTEGMRQLEMMGIKTIVNLRSWHSDLDEIGDLKLAYVHIPMVTWHVLEDDVIRFLKIVNDKNSQPVYVHCKHGSDRTGVMTALYRVAVEGWTKEEAITEMKEGGFGFHKIWGNLARYVRNLDIERIKKAAGLLE